MKFDFLCPHCNGFLNVGDHVILAASNKENVAGLVLLDVRLGKYKISRHPNLYFSKGEQLNFTCPLCKSALAVPEVHKNLNALYMRDDEDWQCTILFSGVYGEKSTYRITEASVESFGDDKYGHLNLANIPEMII
ncbi:hypothetical protein EYV94_26365 [Puteibacter caeruleilacunae]|nr:hypothetical protein EYV94_26365 [Puteibacter caeruleilacunae]